MPNLSGFPSFARRRIPRVASAVLIVVLGLTSHAVAQPASDRVARSFEQLELLVKPGDRVTVVGPDDEVTEARVVDVTPATLRVAIDGTVKSLAERDVITISQRRADSLGNGAKNGAIVGVALSAIPVASICANGRRYCGYGVAFGVFYTAMWTGIGVAIDALKVGDHVVYGQSTPRRWVKVSPLVSKAGKGVRLSLSF